MRMQVAFYCCQPHNFTCPPGFRDAPHSRRRGLVLLLASDVAPVGIGLAKIGLLEA